MSTLDVPKRCACCGAVYATLEDWRSLHYVGSQAVADVALELRNCPCGSTLAIEVDLETLSTPKGPTS